MNHGNMHSTVDPSILRHAILKKKNSDKRIDISFERSVSMQIEGDKLRCIKPPPWPAPLLGPCGDAHNLGKYPSVTGHQGPSSSSHTWTLCTQQTRKCQNYTIFVFCGRGRSEARLRCPVPLLPSVKLLYCRYKPQNGL